MRIFARPMTSLWIKTDVKKFNERNKNTLMETLDIEYVDLG